MGVAEQIQDRDRGGAWGVIEAPGTEKKEHQIQMIGLLDVTSVTSAAWFAQQAQQMTYLGSVILHPTCYCSLVP